MRSILEHFRNDMYTWFPHRADALMDVLDALSSNPTARSVVELSENPLFRRQYSSVHEAIEPLCVPDSEVSRLQARQELEQAFIRRLISSLPRPQRPFWLLGTDVTSASRPFAQTLSDRTFVYQPNPVKGVTPMTIGHQYSVVALLPEKGRPDEPPWGIPMLVNRVLSTETKRQAGVEQMSRLLDDETLPFHDDLCVNVADSDYRAVTYLGRTVYTVHLEGWHDMLVRGKRGLPMHRSPLPFVRARVLDAQGKRMFTRPLWLIVFGQRRKALSLVEIWDASRQRDDVEHFFRFGKQRLLMDASQTPETEHEENWWTLVQLAYLQLGVAREHAHNLPRPWKRYLPRFRSEGTSSALAEILSRGKSSTSVESLPEEKTSAPTTSSSEDKISSSVPSPSAVQRDFSRILRHRGTPARPPTRRGKAPGRPAGERLVLRVRVPVIKKSVQTRHQQQRAP